MWKQWSHRSACWRITMQNKQNKHNRHNKAAINRKKTFRIIYILVGKIPRMLTHIFMKYWIRKGVTITPIDIPLPINNEEIKINESAYYLVIHMLCSLHVFMYAYKLTLCVLINNHIDFYSHLLLQNTVREIWLVN